MPAYPFSWQLETGFALDPDYADRADWDHANTTRWLTEIFPYSNSLTAPGFKATTRTLIVTYSLKARSQYLRNLQKVVYSADRWLCFVFHLTLLTAFRNIGERESPRCVFLHRRHTSLPATVYQRHTAEEWQDFIVISQLKTQHQHQYPHARPHQPATPRSASLTNQTYRHQVLGAKSLTPSPSRSSGPCLSRVHSRYCPSLLDVSPQL